MALQSAMAEALRLTRAGNLVDAARLIRHAMAGGVAPPAPSPPAPSPAVMDLTPHAAPAPAGKAAPSAAGRIVEGRHDGAAGTLGYRLYLPAGATAGMPLVVMLHGCTQSPEDFARGTRMDRLADELGFIVAYPRQTQAANAQKCWNWFRPGDQRRDGGEPAMIAGIAREIVEEQRADPRRVYVAGLSAGGAAAAIVAGRYPEIFAAVGIHSGLACGAARDLPSALAAMKRGGGRADGPGAGPVAEFVPTITFHGDGDRTVAEINSRQIVAAATAAHGTPLATSERSGRSAGGRSYGCVVSTDGSGRPLIEQWTIHGAGHAWSGGDRDGSYTDPTGPDASREMLRFFLGHGG